MSDKYPGGFVTAGAPAGFSVAFSGTSTSYLSTGTATGLDNISGDFTIEYWQYPSTGISGIAPAIGTANGGFSGTASFFAYESGTNKLHAYLNATQSSSIISYTATTSLLDKWSHVAWVRSGSTLALYLNGVSVATVTYTSTISLNTTNSNTYIGKNGWDAYYWLGYISNVRIVKGTALYTATFTPPTQLFPVTNTQLLTCQSPTVIDNSSNAYTITANGNSAASNFTPFAGYTGFNPALGAAAGGVWTIDEAAYYQQNRIWPIYDPYFKNTTLMLHGNSTGTVDSTGTPVYQNNTFLDSSTNNFTITRNGNTTQGTFTPFSQTGWSNFFDGTDDRLTTPSNAAFTLGTGDYTYECWVYHTDLSNQQTYFARGTAGDVNGVYFYKANTTNLVGVYYTSQIVTSSTAVGANQWLHLAACRASGTTRLFINGVQVGSSADTTNLNESTVQVGADANGTNGVKGYMSNARVIKGVALYTSNFTPSNSPLTAVTGTTLLTCQSNRFVDASAYNFALTVGGTPSAQAFSPFVPAYITPTTYSNVFDGSGDYLSMPSATSALALGSGDWTVECFAYATSFSDNRTLLDIYDGDSSARFIWRILTTGLLAFQGASGATRTATTTSVPLNQWVHLAICKASGTTRIFIGGVQGNTNYSDSITYTNSGASAIGIISSDFSSSPFIGYISNFRVVKGTALYTANFTPPTAPLTAITNTSLLTCQSSTLIDTSTSALTITAGGNVQPVTSPTPFPANVDTTTLNSAYSTSLIGGSAYFDGTGDYLNFTDSTNIFNGSFTAECWFYRLGGSAGDHGHLLGNSSDSSTGFYWAIREGGSGLAFQVNLNGTIINYTYSSSQIPIGAWTYLAIVKSGSTLTGYINGVSIGSGTVSNATSGIGTTYLVGRGATGGAWSNQYVSGYISNYRLSTTARTITVPSALLTAPANTELLLNFTNGAIFDNTAKNVLETLGNAQISTTQSKWGGTSMSFPATNGNYLISPPNQQNFLFGTGNFTVEAWVYPTAFTNTASGAFGYGLSGGYVDWNLEISTSGAVLYIDNDAGRFTSSSNLSANTWTHLCVVRTNTGVTMYFNGVSVGSYNTVNNISGSSTSARLYVGTGAQVPGSRQFVGFIDDLRVTKGVARYTTNFTPPTSQLQDQ